MEVLRRAIRLFALHSRPRTTTLVRMRQLERLVVHVEEAMRLAEMEREPFQRLSLLLLDSAAELMLYRETDYRLQWEEMLWGRELAALEQHEARSGALHPSLVERKRELETHVTPPGRRERIEREFPAKVAFLQADGLIPAAALRVLRKLHQYRNEAYHRDELRPDTLTTAVRIYGYIVLVMMRDLPVHTMAWGGDGVPPVIGKYFEDGEVSLGTDVQSRIAEALLERYAVDPQGDVKAALSTHLIDRLDDFDEMLSDAAQTISELRDDPEWSAETILRLIQLDQTEDPFMTVEQINAMRVKVNRRQLRSWRSRASALVAQLDLMKAFGRFADIEDEFEWIEEAAFELSRSIDRHINLEIDRMRGK